MQNIAGYILDHTSRDEGRWHRLPDEARGPYFVSALYDPRRGEYISLVRRHRENSPGCNPLDGREHSLKEMAGWLKNSAMAVRFVGLGVLLGIFELASSWEPRAGEDHEEAYGRPEGLNEVRFRLKGARPRDAIAGSESKDGLPMARSRPGPRRPRYTRCKWARASGINRAGAM
jgi:hypothetical protein